jgi:RNA polymerase sigma-70 factor (ECF subfamily)
VAHDDDQGLLHAWASGDDEAGNALLERHFASLQRFFGTKTTDIDDLVQRTLLACAEQRGRMASVSSFRAYLFGIARNELYDSLHRRSRKIDPLETSVVDLGPTPSQIVSDAERSDAIVHAMQRLPLDLQVTLELHFWEQLTTAELADALEIPQGTVKSRLRRAKDALRGALARSTTG